MFSTVGKLNDALDALEMMVTQHCYVEGDSARIYDHAFMSANQEACEVLVRLRPERWAPTRTGIRFILGDGA
jgi:hypothetical protein